MLLAEQTRRRGGWPHRTLFASVSRCAVDLAGFSRLKEVGKRHQLTILPWDPEAATDKAYTPGICEMS